MITPNAATFVSRSWRGWSSAVQWWTATHRSEVKVFGMIESFFISTFKRNTGKLPGVKNQTLGKYIYCYTLSDHIHFACLAIFSLRNNKSQLQHECIVNIIPSILSLGCCSVSVSSWGGLHDCVQSSSRAEQVYQSRKHSIIVDVQLSTSVIIFVVVVSVVMMPWTLSMTTSGTSPSWSTLLVSFHYWFTRRLRTFNRLKYSTFTSFSCFILKLFSLIQSIFLMLFFDINQIFITNVERLRRDK